MTEARVLAFSRSLYRVDAVEAAAAAYAGCARVEVTLNGSDVTATFEDPDPELGEDLFDAFANHALFETIVRARADGDES